MNIKQKKLYYFFKQIEYTPSVNPNASDVIANLTHMDHLIGTLVKYGNSGNIDPYLAEKWEILNEGKLWVFKLRKNLICENGEIISANSYFLSLIRTFKKLSNKSIIPDFNLLLGWEAFIQGKLNYPNGLKFTDDQIIFEFRSSPSENFLDLLTQPYFGFYCEENWVFNKWKSEKKIISSGSYKLSILEKNYIVLNKRSNWILNNENSPDLVEISKFNLNQFNKIKNENIIIFEEINPLLNNSPYENFELIKGPRNVLIALIISQLSKGPFNIKANREILLNKIRNYNILNNNLNSNYFYQNSVTNVIEKKLKIKKYSDKNGLNVNVASIGRGTDFYLSLLENILENIKIKNIIKQSKTKIPFKTRRKIMDGLLYDIRLASVDIGGELLPSIIEFIFCTKMGVSFPDPFGKIESLTKKYFQNKNLNEFVSNFNQILYDDSFVIPISHEGNKWLYSKNIEMKNINPLVSYPRFDLIEFKR